jgi:hypothetical protein
VTSCRTIVNSVKALLDHDQVGIFNCADSDVLTIYEMAQILGLSDLKTKMTPEQLINMQKIHLVNNVMSIQKLRKFYEPPKTSSEMLRCWDELNRS